MREDNLDTHIGKRVHIWVGIRSHKFVEHVGRGVQDKTLTSVPIDYLLSHPLLQSKQVLFHPLKITLITDTICHLSLSPPCISFLSSHTL